MRRHKAFPRPGDRIRLAVPLPTDDSAPHPRYGTVLERSCGRSNALRVRWDHDPIEAGHGPDAGLETWLADAGWYWDKAHLEVVGGHEGDQAFAPFAAPSQAPASEEDAWLNASPRGPAGPAGGVDGSLDAVAEWEAALASEIEGAADGSWEQLLASALGNGAPVVSARRSASPPHDMAHKDIEESSPSSRVDAGPQPEPEPVAARIQPWTGDDILPRSRSGGKRWGRR